MDMSLVRSRVDQYGVFGELLDSDGNHFCYTLEHNYDGQPKLPSGTYACVRGQHRLHSMTEDFTTFEVTGVPGHSNILLHCGNEQNDSEGCVLIGQVETDIGIQNSRAAFAEFMSLQGGVSQFTLTVA